MLINAPVDRLDSLLLAAVAEDPAHGYAILQRVKQAGGAEAEVAELAEGAIYPALHRLERAGLLTSDWSLHGGRRRRLYRLSRVGRVAVASAPRLRGTGSRALRPVTR